MIPLVVGSNKGGSNKIGLGSDNEVALWSWVDLPFSHQHVQSMSQNLGARCRHAWKAGSEVLHQSLLVDRLVASVHSRDGQTQDLPQRDEL